MHFFWYLQYTYRGRERKKKKENADKDRIPFILEGFWFFIYFEFARFGPTSQVEDKRWTENNGILNANFNVGKCLVFFMLDALPGGSKVPHVILLITIMVQFLFLFTFPAHQLQTVTTCCLILCSNSPLGQNTFFAITNVTNCKKRRVWRQTRLSSKINCTMT